MALRAAIWLTLFASTAAPVAAAEATSAVGRKVSDFTLSNSYGAAVSLRDYVDRPLIVIAFLGTECPLAKLYGPKLNEIQEQYAPSGLTVIGINSNKQDSLTELAAYGRRHEIEFPLLKDLGNDLADQLQATRTPEVFLLDHERVIRYHGRIDDQYGVGYAREREVRGDLVAAIDELLLGKPVTLAETEPVGCFIGRVDDSEPRGSVTYSKDIARILNNRCVSCHRDGEIAPFTLTDYDDVVGWEDTILEVIDDGRMPPWSANPEHGRFANDARLSEREKGLLQTWIENGMPEGDPAELPDPPEFTRGWQIAEPDQIIQMNDEPFDVPAEGVVDYQRYVVDPGWDEDKYIVAAEARPENRGVVHHILVYVIPPGSDRADLRQVIAGYAPGSIPIELSDGVAMHVSAGSQLLFEMHYTPNGHAQSDLSYAGFKFCEKDAVQKQLQGRIAINTKFEIPPRAAAHEVVADYQVKQDEMLLSMTPHMHLRGKSFRYEAIYPDGETEILLDVPEYDFNWQLKYILEEPVPLPRGTVVRCTAVFDNSESNLSNPNPDRSVGWGDQSFNEMMIGFMDTVPAD